MGEPDSRSVSRAHGPHTDRLRQCGLLRGFEHKGLARAQDCMGELNDLFVACAHCQARVANETAAWFALG
jgi:hypothetical protein